MGTWFENYIEVTHQDDAKLDEALQAAKCGFPIHYFADFKRDDPKCQKPSDIFAERSGKKLVLAYDTKNSMHLRAYISAGIEQGFEFDAWILPDSGTALITHFVKKRDYALFEEFAFNQETETYDEKALDGRTKHAEFVSRMETTAKPINCWQTAYDDWRKEYDEEIALKNEL